MKLNKRDVIYASLVFGWISIFWNVYDQLIQSINAYSFGLNTAQSGWVLAMDNAIGLVVLPLFGHLSDKCRCRYGKRTPFILIGTAVSLVAFFFVGLFASKRMLWPYIISLFITLFAMASYRSAGLSIVPDFVYEPERGRANSIANIVSVAFTVVGIGLAAIFMRLSEAQAANFLPVTLSVIGSSLIVVSVYLFKFKEPAVVGKYERALTKYKAEFPEKYHAETVVVEELSAVEMKGNLRNKIAVLLSLFFFYLAYNALVSNFTVYSDIVLHFGFAQLPLIIVVLGAFPGFMLSVEVTERIGRKYTVAIGLFMMFSALLLSMLFAGTGTAMRVFLLICFFVAGVGYGFAMVNMYPLYLEYSKAKNIGQNTGIFAGVMTAAMVVTPILAGYIIQAVGKANNVTYVINQVIDGVPTSVTNVGDYTVLFPYCAVAIILSCISILAVKSDYTGRRKK